MECPRYDYHIHTKYLGCGNATMEIPAIVRECERLGVVSLAITDHLNSLDKVGLHLPIRQDIERLDTKVEVYFGVELNFTGRDEGFPFNQEIKEKYGFQFAIGGIHSTYLEEYDLRRLIDIQHRHHLKTCQDPLVQVLVHPYWFWRRPFDDHGWPWFESVRVVPERQVRELGRVARETGTAIEINATANLVAAAPGDGHLQDYLAFLGVLAEEGATFALGSDAHDIGRLAAIQESWDAVEQLGLSPDQIWQPDCAPLVGGRRTADARPTAPPP